MSTVKVSGFNSSGDPIELDGFDPSQGDITISTFDKTQEWTLVLVDDTPETNSYDHVGSRPTDRE